MSATWRSLADTRATFRHADQYGCCTIFNVRGNHYRLITHVYYRFQLVFLPRMLAGHLGGIRHYGAKDFSNGRNIDFEHYDSVEDSLAIFGADPLVAPPGTKYLYSTFGYTLLSRVVERASGEGFLACVRSLVTEPLGMRETTGDRVRAIVPNRTQFYSRGDDGTILNAAYVDSSYK